MCGATGTNGSVGRVDEHPCPDRPGPPADAVEVADPAGLHLDEARGDQRRALVDRADDVRERDLPHLDPAAFRHEQWEQIGHVLILGDDHDVAGFQRLRNESHRHGCGRQ